MQLKLLQVHDDCWSHGDQILFGSHEACEASDQAPWLPHPSTSTSVAPLIILHWCDHRMPNYGIQILISTKSSWKTYLKTTIVSCKICHQGGGSPTDKVHFLSTKEHTFSARYLANPNRAHSHGVYVNILFIAKRLRLSSSLNDHVLALSFMVLSWKVKVISCSLINSA